MTMEQNYFKVLNEEINSKTTETENLLGKFSNLYFRNQKTNHCIKIISRKDKDRLHVVKLNTERKILQEDKSFPLCFIFTDRTESGLEEGYEVIDEYSFYLELRFAFMQSLDKLDLITKLI